jgi:hypothetical protein
VLFSADAGSPGSIAPVGNAERGLFVSELLKEIRGQGVSAEEAFTRTRMRVSKASSNQQNPWLSSSLSPGFSFENCGAIPSLVSDGPGTSCGFVEGPPPKRLGSPTSGELAVLEEMMRWNASAYYKRARLYARYDDFGHAVVDLDKALLINPDDPEVLNSRCWAHTMLGQSVKALVDCDNALRIRPAYGDALDNRGLIYLKQCRPAKALSDYEAAVNLNPSRPSSLFGRGIAKLRTGDHDGGNRDISFAKAINPNVANEFKSYGITPIDDERSPIERELVARRSWSR